jgi:hypothetical protein
MPGNRNKRHKIKVLVRHDITRDRSGNVLHYKEAAFEKVQEVVKVYGNGLAVKTSSGDVWSVTPVKDELGYDYTTVPF